MPRRSRFSPAGLPGHIIQRGNNRQVCFGLEEDFAAYLGWLKQYSAKHNVSVHTWELMKRSCASIMYACWQTYDFKNKDLFYSVIRF